MASGPIASWQIDGEADRKSTRLNSSHSTVSPPICHEVTGPDAMILVFWMLSFKPNFHSPLSLSSRGFLVSPHSLPQGWCHLHIWVYRYFSGQSWFQLCFFQTRVFIMYSAYKLNKQGDYIKPWHTPFPIWNQSVFLCLVLTVAFWPVYRFLKRQLLKRRSSI